MLRIETDRLILRKPTVDDAGMLAAVINDEKIAATTLTVPFPYSVDDAVAWITSNLNDPDHPNWYSFNFFLKEDGRLIGGAGLLDLDKEDQKAELGYWCGVDYWGQGYTTEAAKGVIDFGFRDLGLERIFALCFSENPASARVMVKTGMTYEGLLRHANKKNGRFVDLLIYAIIREDWENK